MPSKNELVAQFGFGARCAEALKRWPREAGPMVTAAELTAAASVLKRHGTNQHLGLAMYLRKGGATQPQVVAATGDTQVNVSRNLIAAGLASAVTMPQNGTHKVYRLKLKPRGAKAAPAKAAKVKAAKATSRKRKAGQRAKVKPATAPAATAPAATEQPQG